MEIGLNVNPRGVLVDLLDTTAISRTEGTTIPPGKSVLALQKQCFQPTTAE